MIRQIKKGATDQSVIIRIVDSGDGTPETAVEHNTSGIDLFYRREGATVTSITEAALSALSDAHSDGGIEHIGGGYYRLDIPDAAFATGVNGVFIGGTITGMVVIGCYVHLVDYDPQDTVRLGLTALPNAAADAAGGLPISDAGGFDVDNRHPSATSIGNMNIVFNTDFATNYSTANDQWVVSASAVASVTGNVGGSVSGTVGSVVGAVGSVTGAVGSVTGAVGSVTGSVGSVAGNVTGSIGSLAAQAKADVNAEVDSAIETYHLDHLLAATYDPASKPGAADALLNELVESDAGVARFTANALEQGPGVSAPSAADIADAVWEEAIADHSGTTGSTAEALNAAGAAGDPWTTALPGAYGAGSAGKIIGDNINATISSRATPAQVATELGTYDGPTNTEMVAAFTEIKGATWATTDTLEAIRDRGDVAWITATGFSTHSAADVWAVATRVLTANTNLNDPTAAAIADAICDELLSGHTTSGTVGKALTDAAALFTTALTESYRATGATGTPAQILYEVLGHLINKSIASTTMTVKKLDQSTTAKTYTLDDATTPTAVGEAT